MRYLLCTRRTRTPEPLSFSPRERRAIRKTVVILQEYVPAYRRPFFSALRDSLAQTGIELKVSAGSPAPPQRARGDTASGGHFRARSVSIRMFGRRVGFRFAGQTVRSADLVIAEQAARHLETPWLLARSRLDGPPIALWGHGRTYVKKDHGAAAAVRRLLTRHAHWFFAYTRGGAAHVVATGFPADRVTVVQNAIDTQGLVRARLRVTPERRREIHASLDLPEHGVGLFVGALDESKRLSFLFEAVADIRRAVPSFVLLVAGDGPLTPMVEAASRTLPLRYVGRVGELEKAELAAVSEVMLMPGRVGLVALDAFALGTPMVTTAWAFHAPEFEYLEHGRNALVAEDTVESYAAAVVRVLTDTDLRAALRAAGEADAGRLTLEAMVRNFHDGVVAALHAPRR